ncbi:unnamed protein product [Darwinula stevensoni]|uniref:Agrin n=1 Tax=Darwinula stevensoni TaxID=69355 RepID=A0A7R9A2E4_9CRUS|nr:unnamed protein product [Darwinula stevensoni]CAG0888567.1 unnamed protein product [Darwinula stevensoni]
MGLHKRERGNKEKKERINVRNLLAYGEIYHISQALSGASKAGIRCEEKVRACDSSPCLWGGTCLDLPRQEYMCKCPEGRHGAKCESETDRSLAKGHLVPDFNGFGCLLLPRVPRAGRSLSLELWFLARSPDGILFYVGQGVSGQNASLAGDFLSIALVDGHLVFRFDLGSGPLTLRYPEKVTLGEWHKATASRHKRQGKLTLDNQKPIRAESPEPLSELNLRTSVFLGGLKDRNIEDATLVNLPGLDGAIQRLLVNREEYLEDFGDSSLGDGNISIYQGPPCHPNPCLNLGQCLPLLGDYKCLCPKEFRGKRCQTVMSAKEQGTPVKFEGRTFLKFPNLVHRSRKTQWENHFVVTLRMEPGARSSLILWLGRGGKRRKDFLALSTAAGRLELGLALSHKSRPIFLKSSHRVDDGEWHTVEVHRLKRLLQLRVDGGQVQGRLAPPGSRVLNSNGKLWIGGSDNLPDNLPPPYYDGFVGCIKSVHVEETELHLVRHSSFDLQLNFCEDGT